MRLWLVVALVLAAALTLVGRTLSGSVPALAQARCSASYPDFCIANPPPDLDCDDPEIGARTNFSAFPPDPHRLDDDDNRVACETPTSTPTTTMSSPPTSTTFIPGPTTSTVPAFGSGMRRIG